MEHTGGFGGVPPNEPSDRYLLFRMLTESWLMVVNLFKPPVLAHSGTEGEGFMTERSQAQFVPNTFGTAPHLGVIVAFYTRQLKTRLALENS